MIPSEFLGTGTSSDWACRLQLCSSCNVQMTRGGRPAGERPLEHNRLGRVNASRSSSRRGPGSHDLARMALGKVAPVVIDGSRLLLRVRGIPLIENRPEHGCPVFGEAIGSGPRILPIRAAGGEDQHDRVTQLTEHARFAELQHPGVNQI